MNNSFRAGAPGAQVATATGSATGAISFNSRVTGTGWAIRCSTGL